MPERKQIMSKPIIVPIFNGFKFLWCEGAEELFSATINHLEQDSRQSLTGELSIQHDFEDFPKLSHHRFNLLSTQARHSVTKRLEDLELFPSLDSLFPEVNWTDFVEQICAETIKGYRLSNAGEEENINQAPTTMRLEYLLQPVLPFNEPVTIYTAGGRGKSIFADYISVLVQFGVAAEGNLPFVPIQSNVLYLDWETEAETHRRYITAIKAGMEITDATPIMYKSLDHPLSEVADTIRELKLKHDIGLIIVDSQMAATASGTRGLTEAQVASEYYNILRSFHCSTLTIDHITKQSMSIESGAEAPYGTVVKYNRSRSIFELRLPDEDEDSDHKEFALVHRKFNLGRRQKPLGITVDFNNDDNELINIRFSSCKIADNPNLAVSLPLAVRIRNLLLDSLDGLLTCQEIALELSVKESSTKTVLNRNKNIFTKKGNKWGVLSPLQPPSPTS